MKKFVSVLCIAVLAATFAVALVGCSPSETPPEIADNYTDLAAGGEFVSDSGDKGESAVFDFGKEVEINTLVLREKGSKIRSFALYADDETQPFYVSDVVEDYRVCSFAPRKLSQVKIEVTDCTKGWKLSSAEAYLIDKQPASDFRIMGYVTVESLIDGSLSDDYAEVMGYVTQFNLISSVYLDGNGELHFKDVTGEGNGEQDFDAALASLRGFMSAGDTVVVTVLGNKDFVGDGFSTTIDRHNAAMGDHGSVLIDNILAFIQDKGVDGISFDYEYPRSSKDFSNYGNFLLDLRSALDERFDGSKLLTAAIADWNMGANTFTKEYMAALDQIEVMAYDLFDGNGYHSAFYNTAYRIIDNCKANGADLAKINLGLPFYSRPVNKDEFWGMYNEVAGKLDPSGVFDYGSYVNLDGSKGSALNYFNGPQLIYDKTSYAIDMGVGGVMIWHMAYDTADAATSLTHSIADAIADRLSMA